MSGEVYRLWQTSEKYRAFFEAGAPDPPGTDPRPPKFGSCAHLGKSTGKMEQCPSCNGHVSLKVLECRHPAHGTTTAKQCELCPDYQLDDQYVSKLIPVEQMIAFLRGPARAWPSTWEGWPVAREAHRREFARMAEVMPEYPGGHSGRGIVIAAGGWRFFVSLYVTIRVIRHVGCTLPIEVWFLGDRGEFDPKMGAILRPYGPLKWVDGNKRARDLKIGRRCLDGWELKPFAVQHSAFQEVLFLDADCYPVRDPSEVFDWPQYQDKGAVFWPDLNSPCLEPGQWEMFALPNMRATDFESGQLVVDKARCWAELELCNWLNDHSDFYYKHVYGDKSLWQTAWLKTAEARCEPDAPPWRIPLSREQLPYALAPSCAWVTHTFVHRDFKRQTLFQHRTQDKFRIGQHDYQTQQRGGGNVFVEHLKHERFCFDCVEEAARLLFPERTFTFPHPWSRKTWDSVNLFNEYELADDFGPDDLILDVGANIGAFAVAALRRGADVVHCAEPDLHNLTVLRQNVESFKDRVTVWPRAMWRSDRAVEWVPLSKNPKHPPGNSGTLTCLLASGESVQVRAMRFDDLVLQATENGKRRVRLLKIDCEGSEFPILFTSNTLHLIDAICGEYHEPSSLGPTPEYAWVEGVKEFTHAALRELLEAKGFVVRTKALGTPGTGNFWAHREPAAAP